MSEWGSFHRVSAVVTLENGDTLPGHIHLLGAVPYREGPETPLEMLNRSEGFFPLTFDDGGVLLLSKATVATVVCEGNTLAMTNLSEDEPEGHPEPVMSLELVLTTGEEIQGHARPGIGHVRPRPVDYLNSVSPFFEVLTEGGSRLVNRLHVRFVRPLD
jgi:hypothetical protein